MGDRANICIYDTEPDAKGQRPCIYFYTHWSGTDLPEILAAALERGKERWDDPAYLARIIFSEMIVNALKDNVGYGISTFLGDGGNRVIYVDETQQTVTIGLTTWTFAGYVAQANHGWEG